MKIRSKFTVTTLLIFSISPPGYGHEEGASSLIGELKTIIENTDSVNCVSQRAFRNVNALDENHLIFFGKKRYWVNQLPESCISAHRRATLQFVQGSTRVCKGIYFTAARNNQIRGTCRLGKFYQIDKQVAEKLLYAARIGEFD